MYVQCGSGIIEQNMLAPTIFKPLNKRIKCSKALSSNNILEFENDYERDKNDLININYSFGNQKDKDTDTDLIKDHSTNK